MPMAVGTVQYCGWKSWLIGVLIFPCICCCPIDTRPVVSVVAAPMMMNPMAAPSSPVSNNIVVGGGSGSDGNATLALQQAAASERAEVSRPVCVFTCSC